MISSSSLFLGVDINPTILLGNPRQLLNHCPVHTTKASSSVSQRLCYFSFRKLISSRASFLMGPFQLSRAYIFQSVIPCLYLPERHTLWVSASATSAFLSLYLPEHHPLWVSASAISTFSSIYLSDRRPLWVITSTTSAFSSLYLPKHRPLWISASAILPFSSFYLLERHLLWVKSSAINSFSKLQPTRASSPVGPRLCNLSFPKATTLS